MKHRLSLISGLSKKILAFGLLGVCLGFFSGGSLVNHYIEKKMEQALQKETRVAEEVKWDLAPLGLFDLIRGTIRDVYFTASRLAFQEGPVMEELVFTADEIKIDPKVFWFGGKMEVQELVETVMAFRLTEEELTTLLRREAPEWNPSVFLTPGEVRMEGVFQERLTFEASALLEQAGENSLRLTPTGFRVGGLAVSPEIFHTYRQALAWVFPVELPWPLRIVEFRVEREYLQIKWRERER